MFQITNLYHIISPLIVAKKFEYCKGTKDNLLTLCGSYRKEEKKVHGTGAVATIAGLDIFINL